MRPVHFALFYGSAAYRGSVITPPCPLPGADKFPEYSPETQRQPDRRACRGACPGGCAQGMRAGAINVTAGMMLGARATRTAPVGRPWSGDDSGMVVFDV